MPVIAEQQIQNPQSMHTADVPEILGNLEAIGQCEQVVRQLSDHDYARSLQPYVQSSIGEHVRHVLDIYNALMSASDSGVIDYNLKRRGSDIETRRTEALHEIAKIQQWLQQLKTAAMETTLIVRSELTLCSRNIADINSSLRRELVFAASHVIHHCALIGVCARLCNLSTDDLFGVAPATASHWRDSGKLSSAIKD